MMATFLAFERIEGIGRAHRTLEGVEGSRRGSSVLVAFGYVGIGCETATAGTASAKIGPPTMDMQLPTEPSLR